MPSRRLRVPKLRVPNSRSRVPSHGLSDRSSRLREAVGGSLEEDKSLGWIYGCSCCGLGSLRVLTFWRWGKMWKMKGKSECGRWKMSLEVVDFVSTYTLLECRSEYLELSTFS